MNTNNLQVVDVALEIDGYYCRWDEASVRVVYDFTNDKFVTFPDRSKEDIQKVIDGYIEDEYSDIKKAKALYDVVTDKYYVLL